MELDFFIRQMQFSGNQAYDLPKITVRVVPAGLSEEERGMAFIELSIRLTTVHPPETADAIATLALQEARALLNESQARDYLQRRMAGLKAYLERP